MLTEQSPLLARSLYWQDDEGADRIPINVSLWFGEPRPRGDVQCFVRIDKLCERPRHCYGMDAMQALQEAMKLADTMLTSIRPPVRITVRSGSIYQAMGWAPLFKTP